MLCICGRASWQKASLFPDEQVANDVLVKHPTCSVYLKVQIGMLSTASVEQVTNDELAGEAPY